jgi:hypothetical protein
LIDDGTVFAKPGVTQSPQLQKANLILGACTAVINSSMLGPQCLSLSITATLVVFAGKARAYQSEVPFRTPLAFSQILG